MRIALLLNKFDIPEIFFFAQIEHCVYSRGYTSCHRKCLCVTDVYFVRAECRFCCHVEHVFYCVQLRLWVALSMCCVRRGGSFVGRCLAHAVGDDVIYCSEVPEGYYGGRGGLFGKAVRWVAGSR